MGAPLDRRRRGGSRRSGSACARARPPRSASSSAPRDCARRRSWQGSHGPAGTATPPATGSVAPGSWSPSLAAPPRRPQRSRRTPPAGWPWPRPSTSVRGASPDRRRGRRRRRPGIGSNVRRSRPTAAGARPRRSSPPAPPAPRRAGRSGRRTPSRPGSEQGPWLGSSSCSPSARGSSSPHPTPGRPTAKQGLEEILGLTPREAEVLTLVARGYTNREIAATLVISVRTAGVHVSHILRKLGAPNRLEAAAIAHRLSPPHARQPATF